MNSGTDLIAPAWARWMGIPLAAISALGVDLAAHGDQRTPGFILAGSAAGLWAVAVLMGAVQVRRRGRELPRWMLVTRLAVMLVVASVLVATIPGAEHQSLLLHLADYLAAAVSGAALGATTTWAMTRYRLSH